MEKATYSSVPNHTSKITTEGPIDVGSSASSGSAYKVTNKTDLTSRDLAVAGLGVAGVAASSKSGKASLNLAGITAAAAVAINVGKLVQQGKAAMSDFNQKKLSKEREFKADVSGINVTKIKSPGDEIEKSRSESFMEMITFPKDLSSEYFLKIKAFAFKRLNKANRSLVSGNPHTVIKLPIPTNLVDAISLIYSDSALGPVGGALFSSIAGTTQNNAEGMLRALDQGASEFIKEASDSKSDLFRVALQKALGESTNTMLNLALGNVPNPHVAVSFQNVGLKRYSFSWRLSPNNLKESQDLEKIILSLQSSSLPSRETFVLDFPDIVQLEMLPSDLFYFKPMVIESVTINYAPSGVPSFFKSDAGDSKKYPTEVELGIMLREVDIHTSNDPRYFVTKGVQIANDSLSNGFSADPQGASNSTAPQSENARGGGATGPLPLPSGDEGE